MRLKSLIRRRKSLPASKIANGHPSPISFVQNYSQVSFEKEPSIFEHTITMTDGSPSPTIQPQSRPLSLAIPTQLLTARGPYCIRRPKLEEILSNKAAPPWTLSAFMAYLSQAHCLEILEFTMDAKRYRKHYNKTCHRSPSGAIESGSEEEEFMRTLWFRLIDAYIAPNGPREVNLPSDVRDRILAHSNDSAPPPPSTLDHAVKKVMELMEDSVLQPFLNSLSPNISMEPEADAMMLDVDDATGPVPSNLTYSSSYEGRQHRRSPQVSRKSSPPLSTSPAATSNRASTAAHSFSQFARGLGHSSRHTFSPHSSTSSPFDTQLQPPASASNPASARNSTAAITPFADCFNPPANESSASNTPFGSNTSSPSMASAPVFPMTHRVSGYSTHTAPEVMPEPLRHTSSSRSQKNELMTPPTTPPMCDISGVAFGGSPTLAQATSYPSRKSLTSSPRSAQPMGGIAQMFNSISDQEKDMPEQAPHPYTAYHQPSISFQPQPIQHTQSHPTNTSSMAMVVRQDHARRHGSQGSLEASMHEESRNVGLGSMNGAGVSSTSISSSVGSSNGMSTWKKMRSSFFGRKKSEHDMNHL